MCIDWDVTEVSSYCCLFDVSPWISIKFWLFRCSGSVDLTASESRLARNDV